MLGHDQYDDFWSFHGGFGTILALGMIVLFILGFAARLGRPAVWWPFALALAGVVEVFLAGLGRGYPDLGFLHPVNALVVFALSGLIAHSAWRKSSQT